MVENSDMVFIPDIATAVVDPFIEAPVTIGFPESLIKNWIRTMRADSREISRIPHPAEFVRYYDL